MTNSNNKIELLFVIESLQCGGAEKSLVTLLQNIDFSKYNIDLLLIKKEGEFLDLVPEKVNIIHKKLYSEISRFKQNLGRFYYFILRKVNIYNIHNAQLYWKSFGGLIQKEKKKYDVAIAYNQGFSTYFTANKISANKKFAWLNTDYISAGYNINFDYKYYSQYEKVICVSQESEASFKKALSVINKSLKTKIVEDIIDEEAIRRFSMEEVSYPQFRTNHVKILTVSRLAKAKGIDLAVKSSKLLVKDGVKFVWYIVGEGPERQNIENMIAENNLQNYFILLGFKNNPYAYIRTCDIYVQPSYFEGLGLTLIEASILNKPIVTTNFPTAYKIIDHDNSGLICDTDSTEISECIKRYISDKNFKELVIANLEERRTFKKEQTLEKFNSTIQS